MNTPQEVAASIISGHRRGYREVMIPSYMLPMHNIGRLLPEKGQEILIDFMDSGVNAVD